jgi:uncharacterized membrane protein
MSSRNIAIYLVVALTAFGLALHAWYWTQLPDRVATHFGIDGNPNDWMSKANATILLCALQVSLPAIFLFIGWTLTKLPTSVINIPNREYWLQPERRLNSLSRMTTMLAWIAVLIAMEMVAIVHLTFLANRSGTSLDTNSFWVILGTFLLSVFGVVGRSMWHFRLPQPAGIDGH